MHFVHCAKYLCLLECMCCRSQINPMQSHHHAIQFTSHHTTPKQKWKTKKKLNATKHFEQTPLTDRTECATGWHRIACHRVKWFGFLFLVFVELWKRQREENWNSPMLGPFFTHEKHSQNQNDRIKMEIKIKKSNNMHKWKKTPSSDLV